MLKGKLFLVIIALSCVFLSSEETARVRWLIEAENFDGLVRYPRWASEEPGWYALECNSYLRDTSRDFVACCHDHGYPVSMKKKFPVALSPGLYTVGLKVYRGRWRQAANVLEVKLGSQSQNYEWLDQQGWIFHRFTLKEPVTEIVITARQFGQAVFGFLTESREKVIFLDAVSICSGEEEFLPEKESFFQRISHWCSSIAWAEELPGRNLITNSSFELGLYDAWAAECAGLKTYILSQQDITSQTSWHGKKCLALPAGVKPFSRPIYLTEDGTVSLSAFLKAAKSCQITLALKQDGTRNPAVIFQKSFSVSAKWERYHVSGEVKKGWYFISIAPQEEVAFFLDAVQLEYGELSAYRASHPVEAAIVCPGYGNIVYEKNPVLKACCYNSGDREEKAVLNYQVTDIYGQVLIKDSLSLTVERQTAQELTFTLPVDRFGIFSVTFGLAGRNFPEGETLVVILPQPKSGQQRHQLGANMDCTEPVIKVMSKAGFTWQLYCKLHFLYAGNSQPEPGNFLWQDDLIKIPYRNNFQIMGCFFPGTIKEWMNDAENPPGLKRRFTRNTGRGGKINVPFFPKLDLWKEHVYQLVSHYKNWIKYWCIEDEVEGLWHPQDYAALVLATLEAARKADPDCQVGISATPDYTEHLLRYVPASRIDFFGGSSWGSGGLTAKKIAHLCQRYGKSWYIIGVGRDAQPHFWHTLPDFNKNEARMSALRTAQEMINMLLLQDAKVIGHYTGRLTNFGQHGTFDFPLLDFSGTPLVHGTVYSVLGQMLQDAIPAGSLSLKGLDQEVILFWQQGRMHAVTWLDWQEKNQEITLLGAKGHISIVDFLFNPVTVREERNNLTVSLTPGVAVFFLNQDLPDKEFLQVLSSATSSLPPPSLRATTVFLPGDRGLGLYIACANDSQQPLTSISLFTGGPYRRKIWLLEKQEAKIDKIEPGQVLTREVAVYPDLHQIKFPVEIVDVWTYAGDTLQKEGLWLLPAFPVRALSKSFTFTGSLQEWQDISPARIYALCQDWARLSARGGRQIISGGEYVSFPESGDTETACWLAWDQEKLYLTVESRDDDLKEGDGLVLVFDMDKQNDFFEKKGEKRREVEIILSSFQDGWKQALLKKDNQQKFLPYYFSLFPEKEMSSGYLIKLTIPWSELDFQPAPWQTFGFNFFQIDVDKEEEKLVTSILGWAAGRKDGGQVVLIP